MKKIFFVETLSVPVSFRVDPIPGGVIGRILYEGKNKGAGAVWKKIAPRIP